MHLDGEARPRPELELRLEVQQPGGRVLHQVLVPHARALVAHLHPPARGLGFRGGPVALSAGGLRAPVTTNGAQAK